MKFFTYILYSQKLDQYYVGYTRELAQRLNNHIWKHKGFTGRTDDWELKYHERFATKNQALAREKQIKKWKSRKMIEKLINT